MIDMDNLNKGKQIYKIAEEIFPIYRCLTGNGVRTTLNILSKKIKEIDGNGINVYEIPSGEKAFDWTIPKEWEIKDAYIENEKKERIVDIKQNNLCVVGYSDKVDRWVNRDELIKYIYVQENQPDVIPYVTSYYERRYGFCMSKKKRDVLGNGKYHMYIDSNLFDGSMTYGELIIPGETKKELFFSTYICHPSMANNECSGPALLTEIIRYVKLMNNRRYTYRFIFIPETIGAIAYLSRNDNLKIMKENMIAGFNLTCVGDNRDFSIVHSRYGNTMADKALSSVLKCMPQHSEYSFLKRGSDERQYNAPGIDLPVVTFCRSKFHEYKEYHTSADNMSVISAEGFQGSYYVIKNVIDILECNTKYKVTVLGEPQLGKRGLYPSVSKKGSTNSVRDMMNVLAYSDGNNDLFDISRITDIPIVEVMNISNVLVKQKLLEDCKRNI